MRRAVRLKVCGLSTPEGVDAAAEAGAAYLGFVLYPPSPRSVSVARARDLALRAPPGDRQGGAPRGPHRRRA
jgi:phosphoribosylanthranilate isomerase